MVHKAATLLDRVPVLFAAIDPDDVADLGRLAWCAGVEWLLLDGHGAVRRERLRRRQGWTDAMIDDALADAAALRAIVDTAVDTGVQPPSQVARRIANWLGLHV
jgi:hypothetical protein